MNPDATGRWADSRPIREQDPRSDLPPETWELISTLFDRVEETLASKRRDYGTDNINQTGLVGVGVRLVDKTARLHHLARDGHTPSHETLEETIIDIVGYACIARVLLDGRQW